MPASWAPVPPEPSRPDAWARPASVVVLEQGRWPDYSRARAAEADFEINSGPEWGWNPNVRRLEEDYPVESSDSDIDVLTYNAVGGGSVIYAAGAEPLVRLPGPYARRRRRRLAAGL
jgi:hypothetical protein